MKLRSLAAEVRAKRITAPGRRKTDAPKKPLGKPDAVLASLVVVSAAFLGYTFVGDDAPEYEQVPLTVALAEIENGNVQRAVVDDGAKIVTLRLFGKVGTEPDADVERLDPADPDAFEDELDGPAISAVFPIDYTERLTDELIEAEVPVSTNTAIPSVWQNLLSVFAPILLIMALLVFIYRRQISGGRESKVGKKGEIPETRFADVAGCDEAVSEMAELVEFFRGGGERFRAMGASGARGALLVGPPGTGKTLLARALAGEAGVPFFPIAGSDFVEMFAGVGAQRVRKLFASARKAKAAIIFIDEIDAVGRARSTNDSAAGYHLEQENTLIALLNEMDGFSQDQRVIVIAASNRPDLLDAALTRPGRLDRRIEVALPDRRGREDILRVHIKGRPVLETVDLVAIARRTPGMSGADLEKIVDEACMEAAREGLDMVDQRCFDNAISTIAMGKARKSAFVTERDRKITAWHEAGHTVAALMSKDADDPVAVSIIPRGVAGGVTWMSGSDDQFMTRSKALASLRVSMAGRAAEMLKMGGDYTQGAHGDLDHASKLAWAMVTKYGMTESSLFVVPDETLKMGGPIGDRARATADALLANALAEATEMLLRHEDLLDAVTEALLDLETMTASDLADVVAKVHGERGEAPALVRTPVSPTEV